MQGVDCQYLEFEMQKTKEATEDAERTPCRSVGVVDCWIDIAQVDFAHEAIDLGGWQSWFD